MVDFSLLLCIMLTCSGQTLTWGGESGQISPLCCILSSRASNEVGVNIIRTASPEKVGFPLQCPHGLSSVPKKGVQVGTSCRLLPTQLTCQGILGVLGTSQRREDMTSCRSDN